MSITYFVTLNNSGWADVSQGNAAGFFTNKNDNDIIYLQAESLPSPSLDEGHRLRPGEFVNFNVTAPEVVFARSIQLSAKLVVTPV